MIDRPVFAGLDTLRAIASIAVVATHTCFWSGFYSHGTLGVATHRLEVGVPIFFALSGFLLSYPYIAHMRTHRGTHDRLSRYTLKRIARIIPVYLVAVVAALALLTQNDTLGIDRWIANLLMYDYYTSDSLPHGLTQMWSLYVEVAFYVLLPFLMWVFTRIVGGSWRLGPLLAAMGMTSAVSVIWVLADGSVKALPGYLLWFAVGMTMAVIHVQTHHSTSPEGRALRVLRVMAGSPAMCWLAAAAVFALASTPLTGPPSLAARSTGETLARLIAYAIVAALVVLPSVFGPADSRYAQALAKPWARHLGHISYSLFCIHVVMLELLAPKLGFTLFNSNPILLFVTVLAASLIAAELLYRLVEKPAIDLVHRRGKRHQGASQSPTSSSTMT